MTQINKHSRVACVLPLHDITSINMNDATLLIAAQTAAREALDALYKSAPFEPVAKVTYQSAGRVLVLAEAETDKRSVSDSAQQLVASLSPAIFFARKPTTQVIPATDLPASVICQQGILESLSGYLGAYVLRWRADTSSVPQVAEFDLVLDLQATPHFNMHQPPQGYFHAVTLESQASALQALAQLVGAFEKPKFFCLQRIHLRAQPFA